MKKLICILLALSLFVCLAACASNTTPAADEKPAEPIAEPKEDAAAETTGRVHLTGLVSGEEVLNWIAAGDFAAYPGAHSVLWEQTAALGIPAIYYAPTPGDAEYLSDDSALFVRKGDEEEVYAALSTSGRRWCPWPWRPRRTCHSSPQWVHRWRAVRCREC